MKSPISIACRLSPRKLTFIFLAICFFLLSTHIIFSLQPASLPLGFPPDLAKVSNVIESDVCNTNVNHPARIEIIFLVLSHVDNVWKRNVIRDVYPTAEIEQVGIRRAFVVSRIDLTTPDNKGDSKVMEENERFSDLLQLDLIEAYDGLTYKSLSALKWASENCQRARFIIKTDDDLLINYYQVVDEFQSLRDDNDDALIGALHSHSEVSRYEKWHFYVSHQEYAGKYYPPYLGGLFYACSPKTAAALVAASKRVPFFKLEDVYITGFLAKEAGIRLVGLNEKIIFEANKTLNCCRNDFAGVVYMCQYFVSSIDRHKFKDYEKMLRKAKDHGAFCHFNRNCLKIIGRFSFLYYKWTSDEFHCF